MRRRLVLVTILLAALSGGPSVHASFAQTPDEQSSPPSVIESPAPTPPVDEPHLSEFTKPEREDAVFVLGELRSAVRMSPHSADDRLKLARGLYRIGDLDAALDECRVALKIESHNARAYLQLGCHTDGKTKWACGCLSLGGNHSA